MQLIRGGNYSVISYHSLLENGQIYACSTDFNSEIEKVLFSVSALWLALPAAAGVWSAAAFINLFIRQGTPTLWDFWGRGTKIK